jgi:hypothetical protein
MVIKRTIDHSATDEAVDETTDEAANEQADRRFANEPDSLLDLGIVPGSESLHDLTPANRF